MNSQSVFQQSESHTFSDQRRAKELQVITALTVTGEPAVVIYGKGYRLLLPADQALRVSREIIDHLAHAEAIGATRYTSYTLTEQEHTDGANQTTR